MKVMIVDDSSEMRSLIRTLLADVADTFAECADGEEAVATYATENPDYAVMDVAMASMDGLTATRLIRASSPGAQIIVVTQHDHPRLRVLAREAGAAAFLMKDDLVQLRSLLSRGTNPQWPQIGDRSWR